MTHDNLELAAAIERDLFVQYGPMLSDDDLCRALGYRSMGALRQALVRHTNPVPIFAIQNRRGKFALVKDVARWLAQQRSQAFELRHEQPDTLGSL